VLIELSIEPTVSKLADHYAHGSGHLSVSCGSVGPLVRVNCITCDACWLELRLKKKGPPKSISFIGHDGEDRTLTLPLDPVSLLGSVVS
jgi:hypothetical protein